MNGCDRSMIKDNLRCICAYYDRGHCLDPNPTYNFNTNQFICPITARSATTAAPPAPPVEQEYERDTGYYQPEVFTL